MCQNHALIKSIHSRQAPTLTHLHAANSALPSAHLPSTASADPNGSLWHLRLRKQAHLHLTAELDRAVSLCGNASPGAYARHCDSGRSMEDLLARERAAEHHVHDLLKKPEEPIASLLQAYDEYRAACQACIFADFVQSDKRETRLWHAHTEGKKYFHRALSDLRKRAALEELSTALRGLIELYLGFIKSSGKFYRQYILLLHTNFGGIPELAAVAHQVKTEGLGESSQHSLTPELRATVLTKCHNTLIYLGDLSRYRASEKLDKTPDFGPAIGYYGLACTLRPESGMGHHQQAVVALEQRLHLRAIYHLYRAMVVEDPHPNAEKNLQLEFGKTNDAWDKGELIQKGPPNDPDGPKRALVGWFVRLHSMCYKGEPFRGYEELEREVLSQLAAEVKQRSLDNSLMRMIVVNLAAQYDATEKFTSKSSRGPHVDRRTTDDDARATDCTIPASVHLFLSLQHQDVHDFAPRLLRRAQGCGRTRHSRRG